MSAPAVTPSAPDAAAAFTRPGGRGGRLVAFCSRRPDAIFAIALGILLTAISLSAGGGAQPIRIARTEIVLQGVGGLLAAIAILQSRFVVRERRMAGVGALAAFAIFTAVTLMSIIWAVDPDAASLDASRLLGYLAVFAGGMSLVRLAPRRWSGLLGAVLVATTAITGYALLTKVFPGALAPDETYARLREPFGYWNAVGLMAALGVPGCLWLGARRSGHAAVNALAYPALALLLVGTLLAYSRGSLLAIAVGAAFWFTFVPLRLRGVAVLTVSAIGALPVTMWAFTQEGLTTDEASLVSRAAAGHQLGVALVGMCLVMVAIGLGLGFAAARRAPNALTRRRAGVAILLGLSLIPIAGAIALAMSERGLGGSISNGWTELTDPSATTPANDPGRLTAVGSVRARYYDDALKVLSDHTLLGAGADGYGIARFRVRSDDLDVRHAHSFIFQTVADLGLVGLLAAIGLFAAFMWAALRATALYPRRGRRPGWRDLPYGPERVGLITLLAVVVTYGTHSTVDWTWYTPGPSIIALLCAGWVAGRGGERSWSGWLGDTSRPVPVTTGLRAQVRAGAHDRRLAASAAACVFAALTVMWATWQPIRALNAGDRSLELAQPATIDEARREALRAHDLDPLSVEPLFDLAVVERVAGRKEQARQALEDAVALQPRNPTPWLRLADYDLNVLADAQAALKALGPALYLDPRSTDAVTLFLDASRRVGGDAAAPPQDGTKP